nr:MarR family winged helix-turn-helix transcriptional regulator [Kineosporia babensis]
MLQALRAHARVGTELLTAAGVTPPHEIVLLYLAEHGPVPQTELVHYLARDRSTVTATLQAMERSGLVTRSPSPTDKRAMIVSMTAAGAAAAPQAQAAWEELEQRTIAGLSSAEQQELLRLLNLVRDALNAPATAPAARSVPR